MTNNNYNDNLPDVNSVKGGTPTPLDIRLQTMPEQDKLSGAVCGIAAPGMAPAYDLELERTSGSRGGRPGVAVSRGIRYGSRHELAAPGISPMVHDGSSGHLGQVRLHDVTYPLDALSSPASAASRYKDSVALTFLGTNKAELSSEELVVKATAEQFAKKAGNCPSHWLHGTDAAGHNFAKELYCGREWCPVCGKKDSVSHKRRFASWLPKAQTTKKLSLAVIQWPLKNRNKPRTRKALENYGKLAVSVLNGSWEVSGRRARGEMLRRGQVAEIKAKYYDKGLRRWHYFGDVLKETQHLGLKWQTDAPDKAAAPRGATAFPLYDAPVAAEVKSNCHLNVILAAGFIPKPWLRHLVNSLRIAFDEPELIVHYGYIAPDKKETDSKKRMADYAGRCVHLLKYTTRATFLDYKWDEWLCGQLYGFRNMRSWGKWDGPDAWTLDELAADATDKAAGEVSGMNIAAITALQGTKDDVSRCYKDGLEIHWSAPQPIKLLRNIDGAIDLGAGFYELPDLKAPEHLAEPLELYDKRILTQLEADDKRKKLLDGWYSLLPAQIAMLPEFKKSDARHTGAEFYNSWSEGRLPLDSAIFLTENLLDDIYWARKLRGIVYKRKNEGAYSLSRAMVFDRDYTKDVDAS